MAAKRCPVEKGVTVFHSDRGSQYTSQRFLDHLKTYGIRPSVGRTGVCWDNAWAESFNATLKNERVHRMVYPTRQKAINDIASWIELRYNHVRLHSALGYRTPNEIEQEFLDHLKTYGIRPSVGRTGVCWDNAWAESFNATLKNERVHRMVYPTRQKAINDIASWIELRYNHVRLHSALGYRTPNEIEQEFLDLTKAA